MDPNDQDGVLSPKNFTLFFFLDGDVTDMPTPNDDTVAVLDVNSYVLYVRSEQVWTVDILPLTSSSS